MTLHSSGGLQTTHPRPFVSAHCMATRRSRGARHLSKPLQTSSASSDSRSDSDSTWRPKGIAQPAWPRKRSRSRPGRSRPHPPHISTRPTAAGHLGVEIRPAVVTEVSSDRQSLKTKGRREASQHTLRGRVVLVVIHVAAEGRRLAPGPFRHGELRERSQDQEAQWALSHENAGPTHLACP